MSVIGKSVAVSLLLGSMAPVAFAQSARDAITCGQTYTVAQNDTVSGISIRAYNAYLLEPILAANTQALGPKGDQLTIGQELFVPCLAIADDVATAEDDNHVFTFSKAAAPSSILNTGIIDAYLEQIAEVTEGRVTFVASDEVNRDQAAQFDLVASGAVDAAYVLNAHLAGSHPLLQLPSAPLFGGGAEQTAVSMWRMHDTYLAQTDYLSDVALLGFVAAPAAQIWRDASISANAYAAMHSSVYAVPLETDLFTRGPSAWRSEVAALTAKHSFDAEASATYLLAHEAAGSYGVWDDGASVSVMEVTNGVYTPTFSVALSNGAWARISPADQKAIRAVSGEALARRSAVWDDLNDTTRALMLATGLDIEKADDALVEALLLNSLSDLTTWASAAAELGIPATEAVNAYLVDLRSMNPAPAQQDGVILALNVDE